MVFRTLFRSRERDHTKLQAFMADAAQGLADGTFMGFRIDDVRKYATLGSGLLIPEDDGLIAVTIDAVQLGISPAVFQGAFARYGNDGSFELYRLGARGRKGREQISLAERTIYEISPTLFPI